MMAEHDAHEESGWGVVKTKGKDCQWPCSVLKVVFLLTLAVSSTKKSIPLSDSVW